MAGGEGRCRCHGCEQGSARGGGAAAVQEGLEGSRSGVEGAFC
jgi:hypothetical protein